jgi:hypothetical protein
MISLSSSSSSSSLYISNNGRSSVNGLRPNYMLQSLSEYISPSLSKTILSSSTITDDKTATLTPLKNHSTESNNIPFTGKNMRIKLTNLTDLSSVYIKILSNFLFFTHLII